MRPLPLVLLASFTISACGSVGTYEQGSGSPSGEGSGGAGGAPQGEGGIVDGGIASADSSHDAPDDDAGCASDDACSGEIGPCGSWRCQDGACVVALDKNDVPCEGGLCRVDSAECHPWCEPAGPPCPPPWRSCLPGVPQSPTGHMCA